MHHYYFIQFTDLNMDFLWQTKWIHLKSITQIFWLQTIYPMLSYQYQSWSHPSKQDFILGVLILNAAFHPVAFIFLKFYFNYWFKGFWGFGDFLYKGMGPTNVLFQTFPGELSNSPLDVRIHFQTKKSRTSKWAYKYIHVPHKYMYEKGRAIHIYVYRPPFSLEHAMAIFYSVSCFTNRRGTLCLPYCPCSWITPARIINQSIFSHTSKGLLIVALSGRLMCIFFKWATPTATLISYSPG